MIAFIGDVHREFDHLAGAVSRLPADVKVAIQVGDLGLHGDDLGPTGRGVPCFDRPVYYVTGNHDYEPSYRGLTRPTEMAPNLVFVPRGTVLELDGRRIAFLGGGDSVIDRHVRRDGVDWWPEERVTLADPPASSGLARWISSCATRRRLSFTTTLVFLPIPQPWRWGRHGSSSVGPR